MKQSNFTHLDDRELLEHFHADGNKEWLGMLLQRYAMMLMGVCMKYLKNEDWAKEAVQHIIYKVISDMHRHRVEHFKSWLYIVARNHCMIIFRERGRHREISLDAHPEWNDTDTREAYNMEKEQQLHTLETLLHELNNEQKLCLTLFYLENKSYKEISEQGDMSIRQVKSHIQNGKRNLRILMERNQHEEE